MKLLESASLEQLKTGYLESEEAYTCLCCGQRFTKGVIYPADGVLYEAGKYTRLHIAQAHGSVFAYLLALDKSLSGLSDVQRNLLALFYAGKSDTDVQQELGLGSTSTVRNHRFQLKEKERQARVFLALMELLRAHEKGSSVQPVPALSERERVMAKYFPQGAGGRLERYPAREKHRLMVLEVLAQRFEESSMYSEKEVNQLLEAAHEDYVTLRRALVDHGYLHRLPDGSQYWRTAPREETKVDKKELKRLAKETKTEAGVFQVRNLQNGKVLVESTRNLKTINGKQFQLQMGGHMNKALQREYDQLGKEAFVFEVLEVLEKPETGYFDEGDELKKLKAKWLKQLQPYGDRGYNRVGEQEDE